MSSQYDISPEKRKVLEYNAQRRTLLRNIFLKEASDPFRHASGEGGTVFDPALQRYQAMKVTTVEHFRPTPKNTLYGLALCVIPIVGYAWILKRDRDGKENAYRRGEVAYKDRRFKLI